MLRSSHKKQTQFYKVMGTTAFSIHNNKQQHLQDVDAVMGKAILYAIISPEAESFIFYLFPQNWHGPKEEVVKWFVISKKLNH